MKIQTFKILFSLLALSSCAGLSTSRSYEVKQEMLGSNDFQVEIAKYSAETPSQKSLIIFPPTGGENLIDRSYARTFCKAGYDVFIIQTWTGEKEKSTDLELHQRLYTRAQKAIEVVLAEIKSPFVGLLGTSVGALHAAVSASTQDQINAIFIITGGAPITEIIVTSDQKAMQDLYEARQQRYNFKNRDENQSALEKAFHLEPMLLGEKYKNKDLGMSIATEDLTVPTLTQQKLYAYWKPQKVISFSNNHFWTIVKTWWYEDKTILSFFEKSVNKP